MLPCTRQSLKVGQALDEAERTPEGAEDGLQDLVALLVVAPAQHEERFSGEIEIVGDELSERIIVSTDRTLEVGTEKRSLAGSRRNSRHKTR